MLRKILVLCCLAMMACATPNISAPLVSHTSPGPSSPPAARVEPMGCQIGYDHVKLVVEEFAQMNITAQGKVLSCATLNKPEDYLTSIIIEMSWTEPKSGRHHLLAMIIAGKKDDKWEQIAKPMMLGDFAPDEPDAPSTEDVKPAQAL